MICCEGDTIYLNNSSDDIERSLYFINEGEVGIYFNQGDEANCFYCL